MRKVCLVMYIPELHEVKVVKHVHDRIDATIFRRFNWLRCWRRTEREEAVGGFAAHVQQSRTTRRYRKRNFTSQLWPYTDADNRCGKPRNLAVLEYNPRIHSFSSHHSFNSWNYLYMNACPCAHIRKSESRRLAFPHFSWVSWWKQTVYEKTQPRTLLQI